MARAGGATNQPLPAGRPGQWARPAGRGAYLSEPRRPARPSSFRGHGRALLLVSRGAPRGHFRRRRRPEASALCPGCGSGSGSGRPGAGGRPRGRCAPARDAPPPAPGAAAAPAAGGELLGCAGGFPEQDQRPAPARAAGAPPLRRGAAGAARRAGERGSRPVLPSWKSRTAGAGKPWIRAPFHPRRQLDLGLTETPVFCLKLGCRSSSKEKKDVIDRLLSATQPPDSCSDNGGGLNALVAARTVAVPSPRGS